MYKPTVVACEAQKLFDTLYVFKPRKFHNGLNFTLVGLNPIFGDFVFHINYFSTQKITHIWLDGVT